MILSTFLNADIPTWDRNTQKDAGDNYVVFMGTQTNEQTRHQEFDTSDEGHPADKHKDRKPQKEG